MASLTKEQREEATLVREELKAKNLEEARVRAAQLNSELAAKRTRNAWITKDNKKNELLIDRLKEMTGCDNLDEFVGNHKGKALVKKAIIVLMTTGFTRGQTAELLKVNPKKVWRIMDEVEDLTLNSLNRKESVYKAYDHIIECASDKELDDRYKGADIAKMIEIGINRYEPVKQNEAVVHIDIAGRLDEARKRIEAHNILEAEVVKTADPVPMLVEVCEKEDGQVADV